MLFAFDIGELVQHIAVNQKIYFDILGRHCHVSNVNGVNALTFCFTLYMSLFRIAFLVEL